MKATSSVRWRADELDAIAREAARVGISENGYVRMAVRKLAGLPLPPEWERQLARDTVTAAAGRV